MATCAYFGVRTPRRSSTSECLACRRSNLDLFKECTRESNILLSTSIIVDKKGHTVEIPPTGLVSDTELVAENFAIVTRENTKE